VETELSAQPLFCYYKSATGCLFVFIGHATHTHSTRVVSINFALFYGFALFLPCFGSPRGENCLIYASTA